MEADKPDIAYNLYENFVDEFSGTNLLDSIHNWIDSIPLTHEVNDTALGRNVHYYFTSGELFITETFVDNRSRKLTFVSDFGKDKIKECISKYISENLDKIF